METAEPYSVEGHRQHEQVRLDGLKTASERNKSGQFATPPPLALSLLRYASKLFGDRPVRFLDPAIGTGSFYSALSETFPPENIYSANGIELDPLFANAAIDLWAKHGLHILEGDFTRQPLPDRRFNLVVANPPYVRHHHLPGNEKERLRARLLQSLHLEISGLAGLYCYFMLLCHEWMEEYGLAIWLIPSEFMDVNYGVKVRQYLTDHVTLLHIHRFYPADAQFTDALVSSAVVVFRRSSPLAEHNVRFSLGGSIKQPENEAQVPLHTLRQSQKWTQFPANLGVMKTNELTLGDIFTIKRGLATGSNSFFILGQADIDNWQIPRHFLKSILPGPRHLKADIIEALASGMPAIPQHLFLLDCNEPEEKIKESWSRFYGYIQMGKERKIHEAYLASRRTPWYSQENRPSAPFLCTYMGRSRNGKHPFRFIWNRSQATAHNVYLMLYPKEPLRDLLKKHPEKTAHVFEALQQISPEQFIAEGRVYGGGLHKVEPKELSKLPAQILCEGIDLEISPERQQQLFV